MLNLGLELHPCRSPFWARGGHAQTLLGHLLPSPRLRTPGERFDVDLGDGDRLVCSIHRPEGAPARDTGLVAYFFHGLGGEATVDYMARSALVCRRLGVTAVLVNHRGCGAGTGLATQPYHSGRAEDLSRVIEEGRRRFPGSRHLAVGYSLSGNALLLLLTGERGAHRPDLAIAVNAPIHLERASRKLREGFNRVYDLRFVLRCKEMLEAKRKAGLPVGDYRIPWHSSIWEFDQLYTAPASGFADREDYYARCSTHRLLERIRTPTVLLMAQDDPFIDYRDYVEAARSPYLHLHLEKEGGHMGYLSRDRAAIGGTQRWLDYALERSILALART